MEEPTPEEVIVMEKKYKEVLNIPVVFKTGKKYKLVIKVKVFRFSY